MKKVVVLCPRENPSTPQPLPSPRVPWIQLQQPLHPRQRLLPGWGLWECVLPCLKSLRPPHPRGWVPLHAQPFDTNKLRQSVKGGEGVCDNEGLSYIPYMERAGPGTLMWLTPPSTNKSMTLPPQQQRADTHSGQVAWGSGCAVTCGCMVCSQMVEEVVMKGVLPPDTTPLNGVNHWLAIGTLSTD